MSETVRVLRPAATVDEYHNPVGGELAQVGAWQADVEPQYSEQHDTGRAAQLTGFVLYVTGQGPTGILEGDVVEVRGVRCPVTGGKAESWKFRDGTHAGDQITVQVVNG